MKIDIYRYQFLILWTPLRLAKKALVPLLYLYSCMWFFTCFSLLLFVSSVSSFSFSLCVFFSSFYEQTHIYRTTSINWIGTLGHWLLRRFYTGIYSPILSFCQPRGLRSTISCLPRVNYEKLPRLNLWRRTFNL